MVWIGVFAHDDELAEGGHGGDGYPDILFEARGGLVVLEKLRGEI